jgi:hypothetical protein
MKIADKKPIFLLPHFSGIIACFEEITPISSIFHPNALMQFY